MPSVIERRKLTRTAPAASLSFSRSDHKQNAFHRDETRFAGALAALPAGRHAFAFRHPSWFVSGVYPLLREHDAALVIGDHPDRPFQTYEATADWRYVRFHHGTRGRRGNYSKSEIEEWAKRLDSWRAQSEIFIYFNNDWEIFAPRNATLLRRQLKRLHDTREGYAHAHE